MATGPSNPRAGRPAERKDYVEALFLLAVIIGSTVWIVGNAVEVFDFFDMSGFMDAGYRVSRGQRIYEDFFYNAGPVLPYMHAAFFLLFGFGRVAVQTHVAFINVVSLLGVYALARRVLPAPVALACLGVAAVTFHSATAHPWYDNSAAMFFAWGLVLVVHWGLNPAGMAALVGAGALLALSTMTKTNVGLAGTGLVSVVVLSWRGWRPALVFVAAVFACIVGILGAVGSPWTFIEDTILAQRVGVRFSDWDALDFTLRRSPNVWGLAPLVACTLAVGRGVLREQRHWWLMAFGVIALAIFSTWTGSMARAANITLLGVVATMLCALLAQAPASSPAWARWVARLTIAGFMLAAADAGARAGQRHMTWLWRPSNHTTNYVLTEGPLAGWGCNAMYGPSVDAAVKFVNERIPPDESLFVFPDRTILYGSTGREPYSPAPFIFDAGIRGGRTAKHFAGPPPGKPLEKFRAGFRVSPPDWIVMFSHVEVEFAVTSAVMAHLGIREFVAERYDLVARMKDVSVLRRRDLPPIQPPP